jgi:hypothetical protein
MDATYRPRLVMRGADAAEATTWRVLLSLPGRVGIVDPTGNADLMRLARTAFAGDAGAGRAA